MLLHMVLGGVLVDAVILQSTIEVNGIVLPAPIRGINLAIVLDVPSIGKVAGA
jgi:hypothetical protein